MECEKDQGHLEEIKAFTSTKQSLSDPPEGKGLCSLFPAFENSVFSSGEVIFLRFIYFCILYACSTCMCACLTEEGIRALSR